jgi:alcohol dehydrogenase
VLRTGEIIVDVVAAGVTSYAANVFNGSRNYLLETPVAPGAGGIGRVRATGPDATRLKTGDWVYCEPTVRSRDDVFSPDQILQGWTYRTAAALPLHRHFHHGSSPRSATSRRPKQVDGRRSGGFWCRSAASWPAIFRPARRWW